MNFNNVIIIIVIIALLAYYLCDKPISNDGDVDGIGNGESFNDNTTENDNQSNSSNSDSNSSQSVSIDSDDSISIIDNRARGLNNNAKNQYTSRSYASQESDLSGVDKSFYDVQNVAQNNNNNNRYTGVDVSDEKKYTPQFSAIDEIHDSIDVGDNKGTEKDKYNLNAFLPQEEEKDWFETIETVDVKNSHLINIYKPIGVNTIGSCQKNATYDLRGTDKAVCPKFVVSPWLQSTIEPDRSMKSLC